MHLSSPSHRRLARAFTLIELMVVMAIIGITLAFLVPALAPATGRTLEGAARQLTSDLENARQIAITERTKTRILIPEDTNANTAFGADLALRSYVVVSFTKTANTWKQRGRFSRLPRPAVFDPNPVSPVNTATEENILETRKTATTKIDNSSSGGDKTTDFTGAYIEFRSNGATDLDPASKAQVLVITDGIANDNGTITRKNSNLNYRITIDPLTGGARLK